MPPMIPRMLGAVLGVLCITDVASAITVSGTVRFWDTRSYRSDSSGSLVSESTDGTNQSATYQLIYLMDMDGSCIDIKDNCAENDDDYIDLRFTDGIGGYSFTNVNVPLNEQLYLWGFYYSLGGSIEDDNGQGLMAPSEPVVSAAANTTINYNITCPDNAFNNVQGFCDSQADVNAHFLLNEGFANMSVSMGWAAARIEQSGHDVTVSAYWPDTPDALCSSAEFAAGAYNNREICAVDPGNNHTIGHEMGHALYDLSLLSGGLDGNNCVSNVHWVGNDPEKCATTEGFADFITAQAWWTGGATAPQVKGFNIEGTTLAGNTSASTCVSIASSPHRRAGNAARFFWDLYDTTGINDGGQDSGQLVIGTVVNIWTEFPGGTGNRQVQESDGNGRNVEDYVFYDSPQDFTAERDSNCLQAQDDG